MYVCIYIYSLCVFVSEYMYIHTERESEKEERKKTERFTVRDYVTWTWSVRGPKIFNQQAVDSEETVP